MGYPRLPREATVVVDVPALPDLIRDSRVYLEPETERLLTAFSAELGRTYREEQVARCEHYIEMLGEERTRLVETVPGRIRTNSVLCLCCILGVAVLLW